MSTITGIDAYANVLTGAPDDGGDPAAADIRNVAQAALNNTKHIYDHCALDNVARPTGNTGDFAITGNLAITGQISCSGIIASGSTMQCVDLEASGTVKLPGTSPKITLTASSGRVDCVDVLPTAAPAATADPGANNLLTAPNIVKAWAFFTLNSGVVTIHDAYNIASIVITGVPTVMTVTFARAMANANYAVTWGYSTTNRHATNGTKAAGSFPFSVATIAAPTTPLDYSSTGPDLLEFHVLGRQ